jgi:hypothetical protein
MRLKDQPTRETNKLTLPLDWDPSLQSTELVFHSNLIQVER